MRLCNPTVIYCVSFHRLVCRLPCDFNFMFFPAKIHLLLGSNRLLFSSLPYFFFCQAQKPQITNPVYWSSPCSAHFFSNAMLYVMLNHCPHYGFIIPDTSFKHPCCNCLGRASFH